MANETTLLSEADRLRQINAITKAGGFGELTSSITNTFYGINYKGTANSTPLNNEQYGLTFFTRPSLNLSNENITSHRITTPLMTTNQWTLQRAIRVLLDPRGVKERSIDTPLIDARNPFMAVLTNNLISISGFPDKELDTYTTQPGLMRETFSMVDSHPRLLGNYDITANFRNIKGDPITLLFDIWIEYMGKVYMGDFTPYLDMILDNEIDYNTRIYRITLDPTRQFIQKIAACGAAFPTASPTGAAFNYNEETPFSREADQIPIRFRCLGFDYNDPILIKEFNDLVGIYNPEMTRPVSQLQSTYRKLTPAERSYSNFRGYPRIDPDTMEFQIWMSKEAYNYEMGNV